MHGLVRPSIAANIQYITGAGYSETSTTISYNTHFYPARLNYSAGTETVMYTIVYEPDNTTTPAWCNNDPEDYFTTGSLQIYGTAATNPATVQVVLTAGLEKLDATQAATPTMESAIPTGDVNTTASAGLPEFSGIAASVAGQQMLVELGMVVAAFFL